MGPFGGDLRVERMLDQLTEPMLVMDPSGNTVFYNKAMEQYSSLARQPFRKGIHLTDLVSTERKEIVRGIIQEVQKSKTPQTVEARYDDTAGKSFYFELVYSPILNEENNLTNICIVAHEITHQKTFEHKTIQILQELSGLIENANALIFSVDSREYVTEWNKMCSHITGYEKNEILAQKIANFIDAAGYQELVTLLKTVLEGTSVSNIELLMKTKGSQHLTVLLNATPKLNSAGNAVGAMFVGQDITELSAYRSSLEQMVKDRTAELKQALEKEKELVDIKNRFVAIASHEFRIPLSSISSAAYSLRSKPGLRKSDREQIDRIESGVSRMKDLLEDVLAFEKAEHPKLEARYLTFDLVGFLEEIIAEVMSSVHHSHTIKTHFPQSQLDITSDDKLLRNVFVNLLSNAIKFSPDHKVVDLSVTATDQAIEIMIKDQGIGIDRKDQEKIFEPFNRGSNVENIKGTGLGLSIVKKAVETLKGTFTLTSELKKGTTVVVKLNR